MRAQQQNLYTFKCPKQQSFNKGRNFKAVFRNDKSRPHCRGILWSDQHSNTGISRASMWAVAQEAGRQILRSSAEVMRFVYSTTTPVFGLIDQKLVNVNVFPSWHLDRHHLLVFHPEMFVPFLFFFTVLCLSLVNNVINTTTGNSSKYFIAVKPTQKSAVSFTKRSNMKAAIKTGNIL